MIGVDEVRKRYRCKLKDIIAPERIAIDRSDLKILLDWIDTQEEDIEAREDEMRWGGGDISG